MAGYIEEIASASENQAEKAKQIQAAVVEMDKVAQQNMAEAEELSAAMAMFRVKGNRRRLRIQRMSPIRLTAETERKLGRSCDCPADSDSDLW